VTGKGQNLSLPVDARTAYLFVPITVSSPFFQDHAPFFKRPVVSVLASKANFHRFLLTKPYFKGI
jgi:hypothetical protein